MHEAIYMLSGFTRCEYCIAVVYSLELPVEYILWNATNWLYSLSV